MDLWVRSTPFLLCFTEKVFNLDKKKMKKSKLPELNEEDLKYLRKTSLGRLKVLLYKELKRKEQEDSNETTQK